MQFKSLLGGDNVRITGDGSTLTFDVTGISGGSTTGITGASNLGAGSALASGVSGSDLYLKSLVGGTNVTLSSDDNTITINSSAGGGGGGTGEVCIFSCVLLSNVGFLIVVLSASERLFIALSK